MARSRNRALVLEIVADPRKAQKGFKGIQGSITSLGKKVAATAGLYFGTRAISAFGKASIEAASDLEESTNAVERAMGSAAGSVAELGRTSSTALGLSKTALNDLAVQFSAFGRVVRPGHSGDAFGEIIQRATDFASVMNIEVEEAMGTFQSALAGQSRPIREYGIDLSAAAVQAHAMAVGIWDGNGAISEAEKVQGRYSLILKETAQYAGDFAATSDGLANSTRILAAQWTDFQAELGKEALPLATEGIKLLSDAIINTRYEVQRADADLNHLWAGMGAWGGRNGYADMLEVVMEYQREVSQGGDVLAAQLEAWGKAFELPNTEGRTEWIKMLREATGQGGNELIMFYHRLAEEGNLSAEALDGLNREMMFQASAVHDLRPAIEKQGAQWDSYAAAMARAAGATGDLNANLWKVSEYSRSDFLTRMSDGVVRLTEKWYDLAEQVRRANAQIRGTTPRQEQGSLGDRSLKGGVNVTIQAGIMTDPAEVGREVRGVLNAYAAAGGIG